MAERKAQPHRGASLRRLVALLGIGFVIGVLPALGADGGAEATVNSSTRAATGFGAAATGAAEEPPKSGAKRWPKAAKNPAARGADVKDTRERLDRIYKRLGFDRSQPPATQKQQQGCDCKPKRSKTTGQRKRSFRPPPLPAALGWILIGLVVCAMLVPLILTLKNSYKNVPTPAEQYEPERGDEDVTLGEAPGPWHVSLDECRRLIAAGLLAEAFAALHRLTLVALEKAGHLSLDARITNWEYVRRLISRPPLRELLADVTSSAERSVLGHAPPDEARYCELERRVIGRLEGVS